MPLSFDLYLRFPTGAAGNSVNIGPLCSSTNSSRKCSTFCRYRPRTDFNSANSGKRLLQGSVQSTRASTRAIRRFSSIKVASHLFTWWRSIDQRSGELLRFSDCFLRPDATDAGWMCFFRCFSLTGILSRFRNGPSPISMLPLERSL